MRSASNWPRFWPRSWPAVSVAALAAAVAAGAHAAEIPVGLLGTLTCSMERETADGPAEKARGREALCEFRLSDGTLSETYVATFQFVGPDNQGEAPADTIILIVKAPISTSPLPGMLQQSYAADASTQPGPGRRQGRAPGRREVQLPGAAARAEGGRAAGPGARPGNVTILVSVSLKLRSSTS